MQMETSHLLFLLYILVSWPHGCIYTVICLMSGCCGVALQLDRNSLSQGFYNVLLL